MEKVQNEKKYKMYDLSEIIKIHIPDILENYGIKLNRQNMFKLRDEKTPSAKYYPQTNSFNDFGTGRGGTPINLIMQLENFDKKEAIQLLGEMYNITIINNVENSQKKCFLTNSQWTLIGIQGDKAGKNYEFDFENNSQKYNLKLSKEMAISMNDCADLYPKTFAEIINTKSIPYVNCLKNEYYKNIWDLIQVEKNQIPELDKKILLNSYSEKVTESLSDYNLSLNFLKKASKNFEDIKFRFQKPDFVNDYQEIKKGNLSMEIGSISYCEFNKLMGANTTQKIDFETYDYMVNNPKNYMFLELNPYCAFLQKNQVSLITKEQVLNLYTELIQETKLELSKQMDIEKDNEMEI